MFCVLTEAVYGRNHFKVGFCVHWIRLFKVISLHNIVVVREEKSESEFLKISSAPVFNCCVTLKQKNVNATYFVPGGAEVLGVREAGL